MGASTFFQSALMITKRTHYIGLAVILAAITNPILNIILIPKYGAMGAAYSTAISFFIMLMILSYFSQRLYRINCDWSRILKIAVAILLVLSLDHAFAPETSLASCGIKLLWLSCVPAILFFLKFYTRKELYGIRGLVFGQASSPSIN